MITTFWSIKIFGNAITFVRMLYVNDDGPLEGKAWVNLEPLVPFRVFSRIFFSAVFS